MDLAANPCSNCETLTAVIEEKDWQIAALRSQIDKLTRHDFLTGALNRRGIIETLDAELQRSHRTGHPFCFAVIDLDRFKEIADAHGHPIGDAVLKTVSETSIKLLRVLDRFGRLGGQRFGIVLPATWPDQGMIAMQRLSKAVSDCDPDLLGPAKSVTFSAGLTTNALGDTADRIIERTERALEQARQEGGSRTVLVEEALPEAPIIDP